MRVLVMHCMHAAHARRAHKHVTGHHAQPRRAPPAGRSASTCWPPGGPGRPAGPRTAGTWRARAGISVHELLWCAPRLVRELPDALKAQQSASHILSSRRCWAQQRMRSKATKLWSRHSKQAGQVWFVCLLVSNTETTAHHAGGLGCSYTPLCCDRAQNRRQVTDCGQQKLVRRQRARTCCWAAGWCHTARSSGHWWTMSARTQPRFSQRQPSKYCAHLLSARQSSPGWQVCTACSAPAQGAQWHCAPLRCTCPKLTCRLAPTLHIADCSFSAYAVPCVQHTTIR